MPLTTRPWREIAKDAQEHRDATINEVKPAIPEAPDPLPSNVLDLPARLLLSKELAITSLPPEELLEALATRQFTATAVIEAYLRRAGLAQKLANCVTELLPSRALARAKKLDEYLAKHGKPVGPLHGLPISVKEHIGMRGLGLNAGYCAAWTEIATEDAHVLRILHNAGAVFYVRTTQPQSTMHLETDNNLYGVTVSPYSKELSAGGSSGGEGALIALGGSCLGIGTDIGGSIRSPAANNGLYGFKPTTYRIPTGGCAAINAGIDPIMTAVGPLSTSVAGLKLFMKTVLDGRPWLTEPVLLPLHWRYSPVEVGWRLRIAVMWNDGIVQPHPPVARAIRELTHKLKNNSWLEIVDWQPYRQEETWEILSHLYYPDGGEEDTELMAMTGEPALPLTDWVIAENPYVTKLTVGELDFWQSQREDYRQDFARIWNERQVDAILCPVGPGVAPLHNTSKYWGYTSQWNLLDYPAAVFPVATVDRHVDRPNDDHKPLSEEDKRNWELYDPEVFDGLPISLQLVGRRYEDEKVVSILEHIVRVAGTTSD